MLLPTKLSLLVLFCAGLHQINGGPAAFPEKEGKSFTFGNSTYTVSGLKFDWYVSKLLSEAEGKKLVSIESSEEEAAIRAELSDYSDSAFWTSATLPVLVARDVIDDNYFWDATGYAHGPFVNWAPSAGKKEACVVLSKSDDYKWVDVSCGSAEHRYITEEKIEEAPIQPDEQDEARVEERPVNRFTLNGTIYEIAPLTLDWWRATYDCKARGMKLLSIESAEENALVYENIKNFGGQYPFFWLSGSDLGSEGGFYWDSTGEYFGPYLNWKEDEPNHLADEHCATIDPSTGEWADSICHKYTRYICELNPPVEEPTNFDTYFEESLDGDITDLGNGRFIFGDSYYEISKLKFNWFTAKQECAIKGLELVSIESEEENNAILEAIAGYEESFWTSGHDHFQYFIRGAQNYFYWDGTGHFFGPYVNWGADQPDEQEERDLECVILNHESNFTWYDIECSSQVLRFICEGPKPPSFVQDDFATDDQEIKEWDFTFEGKGYMVSSDIAEWHLAKFNCESRGMELASIESPEENIAITTYLDQYRSTEVSFWISGTDLGRTGQFYWDSTGSELGPLINWSENQPDNGHNGDDNCVLMDYLDGWKWSDSPCNWFMRYLCESRA